MGLTLKDLARMAGVHPSTVSRVLNNDRSIRLSESTRERVLRLAREHGYRPHRVARSLKRRETLVLAIMIPDITNPFFSTLFRGVEDSAADQGYNVILCNTDDRPERQEQYLQVLGEGHVDGLIIATARGTDPSLRRLVQQGLPFVLVNRWSEDPPASCVIGDDRGGTRAAMVHLLRLGYRRIAHLAGDPSILTARERLAAYQQTMADHGVPVSDLLLAEAGFTEEGGYKAMQKLLQRAAPEAVFAVNDMAAIGAYQAIKEAGLRVPDDIAVVGFNDISLAARMDPPLTTVRLPLYEMGRAAADLLVRLLRGEHAEPKRRVFPAELVVRGSCGAKTRAIEGGAHARP